MGAGIGDLLKFFVLLINAAAILSEKRFLSRYGLDSTAESLSTEQTTRAQVARTLSSIRLLTTAPLIVVNGIVIVMAIVFG